jgi:serine/threonine-protein kinase
MNPSGSVQVREGDLLAGKYRVERVIGIGGMGVVVAARHEQLDQLVAIKFVRDDSLGNEEAVERFLRESRSAARLRSEHVARVLDVGRLDSGAPYMVMEFLEGSDLAAVLTRDGALPVDVAVALMLQVCEAVGEAHAAGIVHRDLKPENLFLTTTVGGTPRMKVLDFGVSKSSSLTSGGAGVLTRTRAILGSPLYMAPEQMRSSRDVDVRIDVWALGVVLFELLTLRSPFEAETMPELCLKVVGEPPLSIAELRPDLPPGIVAIVERCLEKDRERRYANASELAVALRPFGPASAGVLSMRLSREPVRLSAPAGPPQETARSLRPTLDTPGPILRASEPRIASFEASRGSAPSTALPFGAPVLTPSIPAAWGTEGHRESQQPKPPRRHRGAWLVLPFFAVAALVVFVLLRRSEPAPVAAAAAAPPPAVSTGFAEPVAPTSLLPAVAPPKPETLLEPTVTAAAMAPAPSVSVAVRSAATPTPPRTTVVYAPPLGWPHAPPVRPAPQDDDIPSLR